MEICALVAAGFEIYEIAGLLTTAIGLPITIDTVKKHLANIKKKPGLQVNTNGLIKPYRDTVIEQLIRAGVLPETSESA